jgi:regulator of protease activity HflC (stomatin/prohibitin superfamily)
MLNRRPLPISLQEQTGWLVPFLLVLSGLYWFFARRIEGVDLTQASALLAELPGVVVAMVELMTPRVLRHFIPVVVGVWFAYRTAVHVVQLLYDLPDWESAADFFRRLRLGSIVQEPPLPLVSHQVEAIRHELPQLRIGGPGLVHIQAGEVAVTELWGRIYRVLPGGVHWLRRFEYVQAVLNLHEYAKHIEAAPLVTRDGLELTADITIRYRISQGSDPPSKTRPYPYDESAVKIAAYDQTVIAPFTVSNWEETPINIAKGTLKGIIAKLRLDEILQPNATVTEPHLAISREWERRVRSALIDKGIELVSLQLGRFQFEEKITNQYIEYWQTQWKIKADLSLVDGEARALEEREVARAEAEVTMIQAIVEGVRRAQQEGHSGTMREVVAMRLIESLERVARQSQKLAPLPGTLLPRLNQVQQELLPPPIIEDTNE